MQKISCIVITYNEEDNIKDCLESLKWTDEIVLTDAFSTDRTVQIANGYTEKIFQRRWDGYSQQKNFGLSQATNDWVLFVDADERASKELASEIRRCIKNDQDLYDGYYIPRQSFYLDKWIRHGEWCPDLKLRLIKKTKGRWFGPSVHEKLVTAGKMRYLKTPIYHYTYRDISHHLEKFNRYSSLFAKDAFEKGEQFNLYQLLWKPFIRFVRGYFFKQGFRDGFSGFVVAFMQSFEVFLRHAKLWELEKKTK